MKTIAIVYEDSKPVRLFKDAACIYSAYKWCHRHYCLDEIENLPLHKLPDFLEVKLHIMSDEQIEALIN